MNYSDPNELLEVVDSKDRVLRLEPRWLIHKQHLMHRAVHVLVFDSKGRIYLQKRSAQKDTHPMMWTSSASGHVDPGESYQEAARRELKEELDLDAPPEYLGRLAPHPDLENEFTWVSLLRTDAEPRPNPAEIMEGGYFSWQEALRLAADPKKAAPCLKHVLRLVSG